jgi:hypothetical protein
MATILIPPEFKEFLRLLSVHDVDYLLIGGYAVNYHGYPRTTADMDIWIGADPSNHQRMAAALREFGFRNATPELFRDPESMVRMGVAPMRIEVLTEISGVDFARCLENRTIADIAGVPVSLIGLDDLKTKKKASGRLKDLTDLEQLD